MGTSTVKRQASVKPATTATRATTAKPATTATKPATGGRGTKPANVSDVGRLANRHHASVPVRDLDQTVKVSADWRKNAKPFGHGPSHLTVYGTKGSVPVATLTYPRGVTHFRDYSFDSPESAKLFASDIIKSAKLTANSGIRISVYQNSAIKHRWNDGVWEDKTLARVAPVATTAKPATRTKPATGATKPATRTKPATTATTATKPATGGRTTKPATTATTATKPATRTKPASR